MFTFIIRPFGSKKSAKGTEVNFDEVEQKLIQPALSLLKDVKGRTTAEVLEAGNIRVDMFQYLMTADLVIADVSIHNGNVHYELGIRHAARKGRTVLIRHSGDEVVFDLKTDRYLVYDAADPGASVNKLADTLRATIGGEGTDSPVFQLLPELREPDVTALQVVPREFAESVALAAKSKWTGDLALLSEECRGMSWEGGALRLIGEAQFRMKAYEGARITWEAVLRGRAGNVRANLRLATIYQKLGQFDLSDIAIDRVIQTPKLAAADLAEAHALAGSNAKRRWVESWSAGDSAGKAKRALRPPLLTDARQHYEKGFKANLDHYYSGFNALALLCVECELAASSPEEWAANFDTEDEAPRELKKLNEHREQIAATLETCFEAAELRNPDDRWLATSRADAAVIRGERPARIQNLYRRALQQAESFDLDSVDAQLGMYRELGLFAAGVEAAAAVVAEIRKSAKHGLVMSPASATPPRVLLFTGHRMDASGRKPPRFPAEAEPKARSMIEAAVKAERATAGDDILGIAGGASGGDILFHEVCEELHIRTIVFLAAPRKDFVPASVQNSQQGAEWVKRFDALLENQEKRELGNDLNLPAWHPASADASAIWPRNNLWMLHNALAYGAAQVTLIALWNGAGGDGPGGTEDMLRRARERGARALILDAKQLV